MPLAPEVYPSDRAPLAASAQRNRAFKTMIYLCSRYHQFVLNIILPPTKNEDDSIL